MTKHRILYLAANPIGPKALALDEEARAIQEELQRASLRDQFELVSRVAARPLDLLRALRDLEPSVVHFAGHGEVDGIYFLDDGGQLVLVDQEAIEATFGAAGGSVQIAVLNGCVTEPLARVLATIVPICVGTTADIGDAAARWFSVGFYGALASGVTAGRACDHGKVAMRLTRTGDHDLPRLAHRGDVHPDTFVLTATPRPVVTWDLLPRMIARLAAAPDGCTLAELAVDLAVDVAALADPDRRALDADWIRGTAGGLRMITAKGRAHLSTLHAPEAPV